MKKKILIVLMLILTAAAVCADDLETLAKSHYIGKVIVARMPVPDDKSVMVVYPERENHFDKELYRLKMERVGIGLEAGDIAIIKDVTVEGNDVTFHLIGTGNVLPQGILSADLLDKDVWGNGGSKIRIKGGALLENSKNKISTINKCLAMVCETKALVTDEDLAPAMKEAIKARVLERGMPKKAVYLIMGDPTEVIKEIKGDLLIEAWIYEKDDFTSVVVFFHDGKVYLIKEV